MWNELAKYRNQFLQNRTEFIKSERINEVVSKEFKLLNAKRAKKCREPVERQCEHSTYFDDRAQLAYGWFALPKLMNEMNSYDSRTQWRAINSLSEFLQNPLHCQRAITEMDIVRFAQNTFLRFKYNYRKAHFNEIGRLLQIFNLISAHLNGANKMVRKSYLMENLYIIVHDREKDYQLVSEILRNLTEKPEILYYLHEDKRSFAQLTRIYHKDKCCPYYPHALWMHLSHFLEIDPVAGIRNGFFELLLQRIVGRQRGFHLMNMKCFALLLRCAEGQQKFDDIDGCAIIYGIFKGKFVGNYEYVVMSLMHGVISKRSLWRCREWPDLNDILVHLAMETDNGHLQLYCFKCLRLLMVMPCIKAYIKHSECFQRIKAIKCVDRVAECTRDDLWQWLKREIYHSNSIQPIRF